MDLTRVKPKRLKVLFEKAKKLTPEQKQGILAMKAKVLGISRPKVVPIAPVPIPSVATTLYELPTTFQKTIKEVPIVRLVAQDTASSQEVENALKLGLDHVYSKAGLMGLGKVEGIDSKEWEFMRKLNAGKVLGYYSGDSATSSLSPDVAATLSKSEQHYKLIEEIKSLLDQTGNVVKPYDNETVGEFLKRLIGLALKKAHNMDANFKQKIAEDFGLGKLKVEEQEKMIERIGNMLFEAVVERSLDEMSEDSLSEFENVIGSAGGDYNKVLGFLKDHTPGFPKIVSDEMDRLKRATAGLFA